MDPLKELIKEIEQRNIQSLIDVNGKLEPLFKGKIYKRVEKSAVLDALDKIKYGDKIFDGCSMVGVFWSLPVETMEKIIKVLQEKVKFLFIWEGQSPNVQDWQRILQKYKFDSRVNKPIPGPGIIQVWVNTVLKRQTLVEEKEEVDFVPSPEVTVAVEGEIVKPPEVTVTVERPKKREEKPTLIGAANHMPDEKPLFEAKAFDVPPIPVTEFAGTKEKPTKKTRRGRKKRAKKEDA